MEEITLNNAQTIFTFFYAIYFATTTTLTGKFHPFDTPMMYKRKPKAFLRFITSFTLLNVAPLGYFVVTLKWLGNKALLLSDFWQMLLLLVLSLVGFGFYRIYYGVMIMKIHNKYVFYDDLPSSLTEDLEQRDDSHNDLFAHIIPGIVWVFATCLLGYLWTK